MKKIALLMASAAVAAVISGCTAMQYAPDELKWTTKHSDDEIYGKAVDCATSMLGTPRTASSSSFTRATSCTSSLPNHGYR